MVPSIGGAAWRPTCGSRVTGGEVRFDLWAPRSASVQLLLRRDGGEERIQMEESRGMHRASVREGGTLLFKYVLDGGKTRPDPASLHQPQGVHGQSRVVDVTKFRWSDGGWSGVPLEDLVIYELHVGTCTPEGTFDSLAPLLPELVELGVTAIEVMPVAQFSGRRNWGYDGVYPYAAQDSYGGPEGFARLVDASHGAGLAVLLDVVYNHFGPEGNYFDDFGPYFSATYSTPWGHALNYDGPGSDQVRRFVVDNALHWTRDFHVDGLRLDAIHGIFDSSPKHILRQLTEEAKGAEAEAGRAIHIIAESDLNDPRVVRRAEECGYGLDAQWADDFHHSLHAYLTGEKFGYYQDFGTLADVAKALVNPFVYDGRHSAYRGRTHGLPPTGIPGKRFVVFSQNHDQVGNRADGARLNALAGNAAGLAAATLVMLSPYLPLLFMGEEYGERAPFYFFTDHQDSRIAEATREGRRRELASQGADFVDPQDEATFRSSKLDRRLLASGDGRKTFDYYSEVLSFRRKHPAIRSDRSNSEIREFPDAGVLTIRRRSPEEELLIVAVLKDASTNFGDIAPEGEWSLELSSAAGLPDGGGASVLPGPSVTVYKNRRHSSS